MHVVFVLIITYELIKEPRMMIIKIVSFETDNM